MREDSRTHLPDGTKTETRYICVPSTDLMTAKGMGTQALFGQRFDVIHSERGIINGALYSVISGVDRIDYIGSLSAASVSDDIHEPTHRVAAVAAAIFKQADIKSKLLGSLPRNACLEGEVKGEFLDLRQRGYIHLRHLNPLNVPSKRPFTQLAKDMLGLPYIWGGTGHIGVDCSGLVQSALAATGVDAPRDTDQQEAALGRQVDYADRKVGDLLFWPGHVGIITENDQLLHANAHHMCVAIEPVTEAVARIGDARCVKRMA